MPPSHLLSIDLSSSRGSLALHRQAGGGPEWLGETDLGEGFRHNERLIPAIAELLTHSGVTLSDVERFVTVSGPGSFTGLRVAMASLKAFSLVGGRPIDTVSGAEARALAWWRQRPEPSPALLDVLTHVASGRFVLSRFRPEPTGLTRLAETVVSDWSAHNPPAPIVLTDGRVPPDRLPKQGAHVSTWALKARHLAEGLALAASRRSYTSLPEWIALAPEYFGAAHYA